MDPLFHLVTPADLERHTAGDRYAPPSLASEGFIHLSRLSRVAATRERFYGGVRPLLLLEIVPRGLPVRDDPTPDGAFPHLYGHLPRAAIARVHQLPDAGLPADLAFLEGLLAAHAWYDHPEGPKFVETHRDARRTCGHWLFLAGATSAFHQVLDGDELWLLHRGRLLVHAIDPAGALATHELAPGAPVVSIPEGWWQAAELPPGETLAFGSNVCAPPFEFDRFRLAGRAELIARYPQHERLVTRLTHGPADDVAAPPRDWKLPG